MESSERDRPDRPHQLIVSIHEQGSHPTPSDPYTKFSSIKPMNTITRPFNMQFTEDELETIAEALGEYILHDDPDTDPEDLIGGIPVADRCDSIQRKISQAFWVRSQVD